MIYKYHKYWFLVFMVITLSCMSACSKPRLEQQNEELHNFIPKPNSLYNVLIVSFDSLRADALGVYGYQRDTSPNIDAFAKNSVVFDQAHSAAATTPTSFAAAFSGNLPFRSLIAGKLASEPTIATAFKGSGYKTVFLSNNVQLIAKKRFNQGYDNYQITESNDDDKLLEEGLKLLNKVSGERFFMWLHFLSPHIPYTYRPISSHLYTPDYTGPYKKSSGHDFTVQSKNDLIRLRELYDGEVFYADTIFQKILNECQNLGITKKTIIVLTSDHGEEFMDHGGLRHKTVYEEGIKIPLIIRHPNALKNGRVNIPYLNTDLFPTLANMVNIHSPELNGINLFTKDTSTERNKISVHMVPPADETKISFRKGHNKLLILCMDKKKILFDLSNDPDELIDLSLEKSTVVDAMYTELVSQMGSSPCLTIETAKQGVSSETGMNSKEVERLKSLGYVQ